MSVLKFENGDPLRLIVNKIIAIPMNFTQMHKRQNVLSSHSSMILKIILLKWTDFLSCLKSFSLNSNLYSMKFTDRIKIHHFLVLVMLFM